MDDYYFMFAVNKSVAFAEGGVVKIDFGKTLSFNYVLQPSSVPVYGYMQSCYTRETINFNECTSLLNEQGTNSTGKQKTLLES